jgi:hypothetical protein
MTFTRSATLAEDRHHAEIRPVTPMLGDEINRILDAE